MKMTTAIKYMIYACFGLMVAGCQAYDYEYAYTTTPYYSDTPTVGSYYSYRVVPNPEPNTVVVHEHVWR